MQNGAKMAVRIIAGLLILSLVAGLVVMAVSAAEDTSFAAGESNYQLTEDVDGIVIDHDMCLDLNGFQATHVTVNEGVTLQLVDSANDQYEAEKCGSLSGTINGTVQQLIKTTGDDIKSYLVINNDGVYSAHRFYAGITDISLVPSTVSLGYKATFKTDSVISELVTGYGYALHINDLPAKQYMNEGKIVKDELTLRLNHILGDNEAMNQIGATAQIYGNAVICFDLEGQNMTISGAEHATTLCEAVEAVNDALGNNRNAYNAAQIQAVRDLYNTYSPYMPQWDVEYILSEDKFVAQEASAVYGETLTLGQLFAAAEGATIGDVAVTIEGVDATYTENADWTQAAITFNGIGQVSVSITDNDLCWTATNTFEIGKATIDAPAVATLNATYGQSLSEITLPEGFSWVDATASVGNAGTQTHTAIYNAGENYNTVGVTVTVEVAKIDPTYTMPTNLEATEGDALSTITLPAGFAWVNGAETVTLEKTEYAATYTDSNPNYNTVNVNVPVAVKPVERTEKFQVALYEGEPAFLYRVGNQNVVKLGSLFKALDDARINSVNVDVTVLAGNVTYSYSQNNTWTSGTVDFDGTGIVEVVITDASSKPCSVKLEVVNATNVTTYGELKNQNSVLLQNITMSSGGSFYLSGATLYGNGFALDMSNGTHAAGGSTSASYVFGMNSAILDNVQLIGEVYTQYGATVQSEYNRAAVLTTGNCVITNSYISNCASAVRVKDGSLEMINTTVKGGNFANIDIRGGTVVLDNVTTINQVNGNDLGADGTVVVGLGVVVYYENVLNTTTVTIKNGITQYNVISEQQYQTYLKDSQAQTLMKFIFKQSGVLYNDGTDKWVNTGILSMSGEVGDANISDVNGYVGMSATLSSVNGYAYTKIPTAADTGKTAPAYVSAGQYAVAPEYSFDYTTKNYLAKSEGSNDYCYEKDGVVYISMDEGDTFQWDTSILSVSRLGQNLPYTATLNGTDYTGKNIALNAAGNYTVIYTYTDSSNYALDAEGNVVTYSKTYEKRVVLSVAVVEAAAKHAEFTFGSGNQATEKITIGNNTYISATGVAHDNKTWSYITVNGTQIYYPVIEAQIVDKKLAYFYVFNGAVTITDYADGGTGDAFTYDASTTTMPSALTVVKGRYCAFTDFSSNWSNLKDTDLNVSGASNVFKYAASASASATPTTYKSKLAFVSPEVTNARDEYITMVQYSYTDATNTTYYYYVGYHMAAKAKATSCFTADTFITMADGTQKQVQYVSADEQILVWNFYTGEYTVVPAGYVMNHGYDNYTVAALQFADGTVVKTINSHGFFDVDANEFVFIDENNAADYVGHRFMKQSGDGFEAVELVGYEVYEEYTESWSILSYKYYNCIIEGMLSVTPHEAEGNFFMPFTVGENMMFDQAMMAADIAKYGLYTYEEFADVMSEELFEALNMPYVKVAVGKGITSEEDIWFLLNLHFGIER